MLPLHHSNNYQNRWQRFALCIICLFTFVNHCAKDYFVHYTFVCTASDSNRKANLPVHLIASTYSATTVTLQKNSDLAGFNIFHTVYDISALPRLLSINATILSKPFNTLTMLTNVFLQNPINIICKFFGNFVIRFFKELLYCK